MIVSSKDVEHPGRIYRAAQVSLIVSILRTLNMGREPSELAVPRTVTLCPTCLAKPSVGKPSAARSAMIAMVWSLTSTHFPSCSSTHPVNDANCPLESDFGLGSVFGCCCWERFTAGFEWAEDRPKPEKTASIAIVAHRIMKFFTDLVSMFGTKSYRRSRSAQVKFLNLYLSFKIQFPGG